MTTFFRGGGPLGTFLCEGELVPIGSMNNLSIELAVTSCFDMYVSYSEQAGTSNSTYISVSIKTLKTYLSIGEDPSKHIALYNTCRVASNNAALAQVISLPSTAFTALTTS